MHYDVEERAVKMSIHQYLQVGGSNCNICLTSKLTNQQTEPWLVDNVECTTLHTADWVYKVFIYCQIIVYTGLLNGCWVKATTVS